MSNVIPLIGQLSHEEQRDWLFELRNHMPTENIHPFSELTHNEKQTAKFAIVANPSKSDLSECPNLVWVQSLWAGIDKLMPLLQPRGIEIVRMVDPALAATMSEAVLAWVLFCHRDMPLYSSLQRQQRWQPQVYKDASQKTIGILGLGELGTQAAHRLLENHFNVVGWSRSPKTNRRINSVHGEQGFKKLLNISDIVVNLLPLTSQTKHLLNEHAFKQCKQGASLINFGRGEIINDTDLMAALDAQQLSHAVLDVFAAEPLPANNPYWTHNQVTVLPHISAPTRPNTASGVVADNIRKYLKTQQVPNPVDYSKGY